MGKNIKIWFYPFMIMGLLLTAFGCKQKNTVTDIDGNVYHTITIGKQVWMVENLKVTKYRNGDEIPNITDEMQWFNTNSGAYCNYNNDAKNVSTYGRLYNWNVVNDKRNIAPKGWHVPTNEEWTTLETFLGGSNIAGGKLKEAGTTHWSSPNSESTNESGFSALPGGRYGDGQTIFNGIGDYGSWWTSTSNEETRAWHRGLDCTSPGVHRCYEHKKLGLSIRCIKD